MDVPEKFAMVPERYLMMGAREYVAFITEGATPSDDGRPDDLDERIDSWDRECAVTVLAPVLADIAAQVEALPTTRTRAWDKGWDSVSLNDVRAILRGEARPPGLTLTQPGWSTGTIRTPTGELLAGPVITRPPADGEARP